MKFVLGAAAAALVLVGAAMAQTTPAPAAVPPSSCPAAAQDPTFPDGATAGPQALTAGEEAYRTWATAVQATQQCLRGEREQHQAIADARVAEYNALNERVRAVNQAWAAERQEFCARPRVRCEANPQQ
jgi:hypothetical protein